MIGAWSDLVNVLWEFGGIACQFALGFAGLTIKQPVDLKDIKAIVDLMKKNSISEFELERQDFKIKLRRGGGFGSANIQQFDEMPVVGYAQPAGQIPAGAATAGAPAAGAPPASNDLEIKSPMIGTFYRAPSPESAPYVEIGSEVDAETVVCIIEAMKVMNEIKAEAKGVVTQVMVDNAKPVEFGQPLFKIKPN
jgi:acetyl-CoA carboxylase biotin carboxyl carrier protein